VAGFGHCWLVIDIVGWFLILLADQNIIANIKICAPSLHQSCGQLSQLFNKKKTRAHLDF
jgi:hypothetical protein